MIQWKSNEKGKNGNGSADQISGPPFIKTKAFWLVNSDFKGTITGQKAGVLITDGPDAVTPWEKNKRSIKRTY